MKKFTVGIIDDHPLFREGLERVLNRDDQIEVIYSFDSPRYALALDIEEYPDLFITDISLSGESGLEFVKSYTNRSPTSHVFVLSMYDERDYGERSLRAGAIGYLSKLSTPEEIVYQVIRACQGKLAVSDQFKDFLIENKFFFMNVKTKESKEDPILLHLSDRELEIFSLLGTGYKASEIANTLNLSIKTVDSHLHNIKRKLSIEHMVGLICKAAVWVNEHQKSGRLKV